MAEMIPTFGGRASRSEAYAKIMHHLQEASGLCAVMSHLHNTEDSAKDKQLAKGWLMASEQIQRFENVIRLVAQGRIKEN